LGEKGSSHMKLWGKTVAAGKRWKRHVGEKFFGKEGPSAHVINRKKDNLLKKGGGGGEKGMAIEPEPAGGEAITRKPRKGGVAFSPLPREVEEFHTMFCQESRYAAPN